MQQHYEEGHGLLLVRAEVKSGISFSIRLAYAKSLRRRTRGVLYRRRLKRIFTFLQPTSHARRQHYRQRECYDADDLTYRHRHAHTKRIFVAFIAGPEADLPRYRLAHIRHDECYSLRLQYGERETGFLWRSQAYFHEQPE